MNMTELKCSAFFKKADYKLVVSDLDGTLLDGHQQIPKKTLGIIHEFVSAGGLFTIATGRNEVSVKPYLEKLGISIPCIVLNGVKVVSGNKVVYERKLPKEQAYDTITLLRKYDCGILLYKGKQTYIETYSDDICTHLKKDGTDAVKVDDLTQLLKDDPNKILVIGTDSRIRDLLLEFKTRYKIPPNIVKSEDAYLEILPSGVSKGAALEKLASYLKVPLSKVVAFGDNLNDLEMLNTAGLGIAVRNANSELLQKVGCVTDSNEEEGVGNIIERLLASNK